MFSLLQPWLQKTSHKACPLLVVSLRFFSLSPRALGNGLTDYAEQEVKLRNTGGSQAWLSAKAGMPWGRIPVETWAYCLFAPSGIPLQWKHGVERQPDHQHGKDPLDTVGGWS